MGFLLGKSRAIDFTSQELPTMESLEARKVITAFALNK